MTMIHARARRHLLLRLSLLLSLIAVVFTASAQPRAWLDRDQIGSGETVTLNVETDGASQPDFAPLQRDFVLSGRSSRVQVDNTGVRSLYAVALRPLRDGTLAIPALTVGNQRTQPLTLQVAPGNAAPPPRGDEDAFIESEPDDARPYVQQAVGWVVRLYSAAPLVSGGIEQPAPEGASLQQVGEDARYSREVGGRRYEVIERRYLLIPERSGALTVPGARFEGRGVGGMFDELFGGRGAELSAQAPARTLQVQAVPANAPQPWLPLRDLQLRYVTTPRDLRAGAAATLTIEATADGASAAQMPELQLPPIDGVQVFADPVQADETFREGRPRVKLTRKFSLVPSGEGAAKLSGMQLAWWDVKSGTARTVSLPPLSWAVARADGTAPAAVKALPSGEIVGPAPARAAGSSGANRVWILATLLFAALWLFTLVWGFHQRHHAHARAASHGHDADGSPSPQSGGHRSDAKVLQRALDTGDLGEVADALCALAMPPVRDVDAMRTQLADARQQAAIDALQRARWGGGDGSLARRQLRDAFAKGPHWKPKVVAAASPLPPLYPPG
ncbi:BatD family protein [Lysobacter fragariae]